MQGRRARCRRGLASRPRPGARPAPVPVRALRPVPAPSRPPGLPRIHARCGPPPRRRW
jgi:hypothetical protein